MEQWRKTLEYLRGKASNNGALSAVDNKFLFDLIDTLLGFADEASQEDFFGTEGYETLVQSVMPKVESDAN